MKNKLEIVGILVVIIGLGFIFQHKYLNDFPSHKHAWAQSDRYALSLGFIENGFNFFEPQTFVYNHQFPDDWKAPSKTTITAVDFPIHDYVSAILMKVFGSTSSFVFRLYILLSSFIGLFFLFKLSYNLTNNYLQSIFVVVFSATSPVYVYYQAGFLPTIPSLSSVIIGIYFYYQFIKEAKNKDFYLCILFLTFGALSRTTFVIPIVAVLCVEFIRFLRKETELVSKLAPVSLSILSILSYFFYNGYLRDKYGSIFLSHILPPESIEDAKEIIEDVYDKWIFQYFTESHYIILLLSVVFMFFFLLIKKSRIEKSKLFFGTLAIIYLFGCFLFAILMLRQFTNHDYYFIDTFFLPISLMLIFFLSLFPAIKVEIYRVISIVSVFVIIKILLPQPIKSQEERRVTGYWDKTKTTIDNYQNSSLFLDSIGISRDSKILLLDAVAPNIPFILMERKGYVVMRTNQENIEEALKWDYDYIITENESFISSIYTLFPNLLSKLDKIADNGKISVSRRSKNSKQSLIEFIGINNRELVLESIVTHDTLPDKAWQNFDPINDVAYNSKFSGHITKDVLYGLTYKSKNFPQLKTSPRTLLFSSYFLTDTIISSRIVVAIDSNEENIYYKSIDVKDLIKSEGKWENVSLIFELPKIKSNDYKFSIFIVNTGKSDFYYDDFGFSIY